MVDVDKNDKLKQAKRNGLSKKPELNSDGEYGKCEKKAASALIVIDVHSTNCTKKPVSSTEKKQIDVVVLQNERRISCSEKFLWAF
jgi:hypothetical protein